MSWYFSLSTVLINGSSIEAAISHLQKKRSQPVKCAMCNRIWSVGSSLYVLRVKLLPVCSRWHQRLPFSVKHSTSSTFITAYLLLYSHNQIRKLSNDMMERENKLNVFDLSYNRIVNVERRTFRSLRKLKVLNLTRNDITFIKKNAFQRNKLVLKEKL